jgi:HK97 gp10 family phage protein
MKLSVSGLEGLQAQLKEIGNEATSKELPKAMRAAFKSVVETSRRLVPRDSGDLSEAIASKTVKGDGFAAVGIVVRSNTKRSKQATIAAAAFGEAQSKALPPSRRWHFIELGTKSQAPKPFIRPALDMESQNVIDSLKGELNKKIDAAAKRSSKGKK